MNFSTSLQNYLGVNGFCSIPVMTHEFFVFRIGLPVWAERIQIVGQVDHGLVTLGSFSGKWRIIRPSSNTTNLMKTEMLWKRGWERSQVACPPHTALNAPSSLPPEFAHIH